MDFASIQCKRRKRMVVPVGAMVKSKTLKYVLFRYHMNKLWILKFYL
jgi:hypothetical protein